MDPIKRYALDIAKEIVVAKMSNSTIHPNKENGVQVADFFEESIARLSFIQVGKLTTFQIHHHLRGCCKGLHPFGGRAAVFSPLLNSIEQRILKALFSLGQFFHLQN